MYYWSPLFAFTAAQFNLVMGVGVVSLAIGDVAPNQLPSFLTAMGLAFGVGSIGILDYPARFLSTFEYGQSNLLKYLDRFKKEKKEFLDVLVARLKSGKTFCH